MKKILLRDSTPLIMPVSRTEAKTFLRVEHTDEDALISSLIETATAMCEKRLQRSLITQQWTVTYNHFHHSSFKLYYGNVQSVESITYYDTENVGAIVPASDYSLVDNMLASVELNYNKTWPSITLKPSNGVEIKYTCGYGDNGSDIPRPIRQGILNYVATLYEGREVDGALPESVMDLWSTYKIWTL